jgi:hypothetical protein
MICRRRLLKRASMKMENSEAVIPAKAGIQFRKTGFRVKP